MVQGQNVVFLSQTSLLDTFEWIARNNAQNLKKPQTCDELQRICFFASNPTNHGLWNKGKCNLKRFYYTVDSSISTAIRILWHFISPIVEPNRWAVASTWWWSYHTEWKKFHQFFQYLDIQKNTSWISVEWIISYTQKNNKRSPQLYESWDFLGSRVMPWRSRERPPNAMNQKVFILGFAKPQTQDAKKPIVLWR